MNISAVSIILMALSIELNATEPEYRMGSEFTILNQLSGLEHHYGDKTGQGLSYFLYRNYGRGHGERLLFDFVDYSSLSLLGTPSSARGHTHLYSFGMTLNYTYHLRGKAVGPYVLAGFGGRVFQGTGDFPAGTIPTGFGENSRLGPVRYSYCPGPKLSFQLGGGWDFGPHWGALARYQVNRSQGHTLSTVEGGVTYRF